jgi:hypothetical protein
MKLKHIVEATDNQFFTDRNQIREWLKSKNVDDFIIKPDLSVDVTGDVKISFDEKLEYLPVQFNSIYGSFNIQHCGLKTLNGAPREVTGSYIIAGNKLTSLEGVPKEIPKYFMCEHNLLTSLEGGPRVVGESYACSFNKLVDLKGGPREVSGNFYCVGMFKTKPEHRIDIQGSFVWQ